METFRGLYPIIATFVVTTQTEKSETSEGPKGSIWLTLRFSLLESGHVLVEHLYATQRQTPTKTKLYSKQEFEENFCREDKELHAKMVQHAKEQRIAALG